MSGIKENLQTALNSGKYFITISYMKNQKGRQDDLQHFWVTKDYPKDSIIPSLDHIQNDFIEKEGIGPKKHEPKSRDSMHDW